jgi:hypothetical protein
MNKRYTDLKQHRKENSMEFTSINLSNHQVQDILEELGMLENGNCPYTAEEIFKA